MRISDWSSDVCSSDLTLLAAPGAGETVARFLRMLSENRRMELLPEIAGLYEELRHEAERVVKAKVTSAAALHDAELESIRAALRTHFGSKVELYAAIDAKIGSASWRETGEQKE